MNKKYVVIAALLILPWFIIAGFKLVHRHTAKAPVAVTQPVVVASVTAPSPAPCRLSEVKVAPKFTVHEVKRAVAHKPVVRSQPKPVLIANCPFLFWDHPCK